MKLKVVESYANYPTANNEFRQHTLYFYGLSDTEVAMLVHLLTTADFGNHEVKLISATRDTCIASVKSPYLYGFLMILASAMIQNVCARDEDFENIMKEVRY